MIQKSISMEDSTKRPHPVFCWYSLFPHSHSSFTAWFTFPYSPVLIEYSTAFFNVGSRDTPRSFQTLTQDVRPEAQPSHTAVSYREHTAAGASLKAPPGPRSSLLSSAG